MTKRLTTEREAEIRISVGRLIRLSPKAATTVQLLLAEISALRVEVERLKEFEWKYQELSKLIQKI